MKKLFVLLLVLTLPLLFATFIGCGSDESPDDEVYEPPTESVYSSPPDIVYNDDYFENTD